MYSFILSHDEVQTSQSRGLFCFFKSNFTLSFSFFSFSILLIFLLYFLFPGNLCTYFTVNTIVLVWIAVFLFPVVIILIIIIVIILIIIIIVIIFFFLGNLCCAGVGWGG